MRDFIYVSHLLSFTFGAYVGFACFARAKGQDPSVYFEWRMFCLFWTIYSMLILGLVHQLYCAAREKLFGKEKNLRIGKTVGWFIIFLGLSGCGEVSEDGRTWNANNNVCQVCGWVWDKDHPERFREHLAGIYKNQSVWNKSAIRKHEKEEARVFWRRQECKNGHALTKFKWRGLDRWKCDKCGVTASYDLNEK